MEKMLLSSTFSFSHDVFIKPSLLGPSEYCVVKSQVTITLQNFRFVQIEFCCLQMLSIWTNPKFVKLKVFADNKINVTHMMISLLDRVENTAGKGENAGYQHSLLFPHCFQKLPSSGSLKVVILW